MFFDFGAFGGSRISRLAYPARPPPSPGSSKKYEQPIFLVLKPLKINLLIIMIFGSFFGGNLGSKIDENERKIDAPMLSYVGLGF